MKRLLFFGAVLSVIAGASPQGVPVLTIKTGIGTSGTATQVLAANPYRGYLILQNQSSSNCFVAPVSFSGINALLVTPGQNYETVEAFTKTAWYANCSSPGASLVFLEANY